MGKGEVVVCVIHNGVVNLTIYERYELWTNFHPINNYIVIKNDLGKVQRYFSGMFMPEDQYRLMVLENIIND